MNLLIKAVKLWQKLTPVNKNLVLFESMGDMSDNSYPVYDYLLKNTKKYKFVWVVKDPKKYKDSKRVKYIAFTLRNLKSIYYLAKAKYCFYTHEPCGILNKKTQQRIFLTHGFSYKNAKGQFWPCEFNTTAVSLSDYHREIENLSCPGEINISVALGYPRNDVLVNGPSAHVTIGKNYKKLFVWLPTYRSHNADFAVYRKENVNEFNLISPENLALLNETLKADDSLLIIKYHPAQKLEKADFEKLSNIKTLSNDDLLNMGIKLYDLLAVSDALITDFSSVFADYLLTDRPIAFELSDYENFSEGKGFITNDPLSHMPGKFIYNISDLNDFINDVMNSKDDYAEQRKKERDLIHKYQDGCSTERVLKYFKLI